MVLLVLSLALAAQAATTEFEPLAPGQDVDGRKGPWFCHGRDCPRFKTVRGMGQLLGCGHSFPVQRAAAAGRQQYKNCTARCHTE